MQLNFSCPLFIGVLEEAIFYHIPGLIDILHDRLAHPGQESDCTPLTRSQVIAFLLQSPYTSDRQLRFQGAMISFLCCSI
jgi:hypothetical protein